MARFAISIFTAASSVFQNAHALTLVSRNNVVASSHLSFDAFVQKHGRDYQVGSAEYKRRKMVYDRRVEAILRHNSNPARLWTAGINHLSDATDEEYQFRLGWRHHGHKSDASIPHVASLLEITPPESFSWMNLTMARLVRDQGSCGSCWAVASAGTLEGGYEVAFGKHRSFSAQQFVDCVSNPLSCGGTGGCQGATAELAFDWAVYNGLNTLEESPYHAAETTCQRKPFRASKAEQGKLDEDGRLLAFVPPANSDPSLVAVRGGQAIGLTGFTTLPANSYMPLIEAVMQAPVAVTVAASSWSSYYSGIFTSCDFNVNHAVVLMGFGKDSANTKYWLIRNSWGEGWGESGFIRLFRADDEESVCGVDESPKDGVSCEGGPAKVKVCGTCGILYDNVVPIFDGKEHPAGSSGGAPESETIFKQE